MFEDPDFHEDVHKSCIPKSFSEVSSYVSSYTYDSDVDRIECMLWSVSRTLRCIVPVVFECACLFEWSSLLGVSRVSVLSKFMMRVRFSRFALEYIRMLRHSHPSPMATVFEPWFYLI